MKKFWMLVLMIGILMWAVPCIQAEELLDSGMFGVEGNNLTWTLNHEGTLTISGEGKITEIPWQKYNERIKNIFIENGAMSIGEHAFNGCNKLENITLPDSITEIGECAFYNCSSLESIIIPEKVTSIGRSAFSRCGLRNVTVPNSVTSMGMDVFEDCVALETVVLSEQMTEVPNFTFSGCSSLSDVTLPESITIIQPNAFGDCQSVQNITLPANLISIKNSAFEGCSSLKCIDIPSATTEVDVGTHAFRGCSSLEEINVDDGNTTYASRGGVMFTKDMKTLIKYPIGKKDKTYTVPDIVNRLQFGSFEQCEYLEMVLIPDGVTYIGGAFEFCKSLKGILLPKKLQRIDNYAFYGCEKFSDVYYMGNKAEWKNINISSLENDAFIDADIHFNATGTNPPQIGDLTLGSSLSGGIVDLIKVPLTDTEYDSEMVTVFYRNGVMIDMQITPVKLGDEMKDIPIPENSGADRAKVFIWSSLESMKPLCEAKEINITL